MPIPSSVAPASAQPATTPTDSESDAPAASEPAPPATAQDPSPPRRQRWRRVVVVAFAVVLAVVLGAVTGTVARPHLVALPRFVGGIEDPERDRAVAAILDRRERAVREGDRALFIADIDGADPAFVRSQEQTFENLRKLPVQAAYFHDLDRTSWHVDARWDRRLGSRVLLAKVTIRYRFAGFDGGIVGAPWVPAFTRRVDGWRLVGQASGPQYPPGSGAQLWDAGPLAVHRAGQVLVIGSARDKARLPRLAKRAEAGRRRVPELIPGWTSGLVLIAVRDLAVLRATLADPERVDNYGGVAVPQFALVPEWVSADTYLDLAGARVILHPEEWGESEDWVVTLIAHEYTHVATMPWNYESTPTWLTEGFADYIADRRLRPTETYNFDTLDGAAAVDRLPDELPTDESFDRDGAEISYAVGWLACHYLSEQYGEAKLIALYRWFAEHADTADTADLAGFTDRALRAVIGVGTDRFTRDVFSYGNRLMG